MLWDSVRLAFTAIIRNKLRSFLTVLGVVIGVAAVIAMVTVGEGSSAQVQCAGGAPRPGADGAAHGRTRAAF